MAAKVNEKRIMRKASTSTNIFPRRWKNRKEKAARKRLLLTESEREKRSVNPINIWTCLGCSVECVQKPFPMRIFEVCVAGGFAFAPCRRSGGAGRSAARGRAAPPAAHKAKVWRAQSSEWLVGTHLRTLSSFCLQLTASMGISSVYAAKREKAFSKSVVEKNAFVCFLKARRRRQPRIASGNDRASRTLCILWPTLRAKGSLGCPDARNKCFDALKGLNLWLCAAEWVNWDPLPLYGAPLLLFLGHSNGQKGMNTTHSLFCCIFQVLKFLLETNF